MSQGLRPVQIMFIMPRLQPGPISEATTKTNTPTSQTLFGLEIIVYLF